MGAPRIPRSELRRIFFWPSFCLMSLQAPWGPPGFEPGIPGAEPTLAVPLTSWASSPCATWVPCCYSSPRTIDSGGGQVAPSGPKIGANLAPTFRILAAFLGLFCRNLAHFGHFFRSEKWGHWLTPQK